MWKTIKRWLWPEEYVHIAYAVELQRMNAALQDKLQALDDAEIADSLKWRPIKTCKKPSGMVLLTNMKAFSPAVWVGHWYSLGEPPRWVDDIGSFGMPNVNPTHWQPLPEPPQPKEQE